MMSKRILFLVEVAIFSALAFVLDIIPFLSFKLWAQGGSVSLAMVPVFIIAFRWGIKGGMASGLLLGAYQILVGAYIVALLQAFLDYVVAFTVIGLAGVVAKPLYNAVSSNNKGQIVLWIMIGCFIGSLLRFFSHFVGGIIFFGYLAPPNQPVWIYSLIYNGGYMLPAFILSTVIISLLFVKRPKLLLR